MSTRGHADRKMGHDDGCDSRDAEATRLLLLVLKELQERLSAPGEGGQEPAPEEGERWEGGGYFYLEAALPGSAEAEIDVNIQGGRAFIRMAR